MKRTIAMVVMLLVAATTYATDKEKKEDSKKAAVKKVAVINNNPQQFKLVYLKNEEGKVRVTLQNAHGSVIHRSWVQNKEGFIQPFDLTDQPAGDYTFSIVSPDGSEDYEQITLTKPALETNFVADVLNVNDDKKFRLAVVNKNDWSMPTSITVYDQDFNAIYEEKLTNPAGFWKIYDLTDVPGERFTFEITNATGAKYLMAK
ncbi:MAG: hypothetical protein R3345_05580 [Fulvivirga sp.]|nr:hypothetical protein [Fulvivirga sp.]